VKPSLIRKVRAERELARRERQLAAQDLHEAFLYGGPLEQERREHAELHLAAARQHERIADAIERAAAAS
jgi:hypothetical protein